MALDHADDQALGGGDARHGLHPHLLDGVAGEQPDHGHGRSFHVLGLGGLAPQGAAEGRLEVFFRGEPEQVVVMPAVAATEQSGEHLGQGVEEAHR